VFADSSKRIEERSLSLRMQEHLWLLNKQYRALLPPLLESLENRQY
jgi:hypothetical protein